jgi:hypothetical protein
MRARVCAHTHTPVALLLNTALIGYKFGRPILGWVRFVRESSAPAHDQTSLDHLKMFLNPLLCHFELLFKYLT